MKLYELKENYKQIAEYLYEEEIDNTQLEILLSLRFLKKRLLNSVNFF